MRRLVLLLAIGCSKSPCERAVHRVFDITAHAGPPGSAPKADEQAVIDAVENMAVGACEKEGLSDAQYACIMAMKGFSDLERIRACPAIAAKQPSWLVAGPPPTP